MSKQTTTTPKKVTIPTIPQYIYQVPVEKFAAYGIFPPLRCQAGAHVSSLFPQPQQGLFHPDIYVTGGCSEDGTPQPCNGYFLDLREPRWVELNQSFRKRYFKNLETVSHTRDYILSTMSDNNSQSYPADSPHHPLAIAGMIHTSTPPSPRYYHTVTVANNFIWVIGGWDGYKALPDLYALDPKTLEWFVHPASPQHLREIEKSSKTENEMDIAQLIQNAALQTSQQSTTHSKQETADEANAPQHSVLPLSPLQYHNAVAFGAKKQFILIYGSWGVPVAKQVLIFNTGLSLAVSCFFIVSLSLYN